MFELRMNLADVLKKENDIIEYLNMVYNRRPFNKVKFWYNGSLKQHLVDDFGDRCKNKLPKKLNIKITNRKPNHEFAWFDIMSDDNKDNSINRFSYRYKNQKDIISGIMFFYQTMEQFINTKVKKTYTKEKSLNPIL